MCSSYNGDTIRESTKNVFDEGFLRSIRLIIEENKEFLEAVGRL